MPYRGYFALNNKEVANSARVVAHVGGTAPTTDYGFWSVPPDDDCAQVETDAPGSLLYVLPASSVPDAPGSLLATPPDGSKRFSEALFEFGDCWETPAICSTCRNHVTYDDSWEGLREFLGDIEYRPEMAPWYTTELPESGEFGGVWVMSVEGLDSTPIQREITQAVGDGGIAGPHRDGTRTVIFEALLIACSNAGVEFGLDWLTCLLRSTTDNVDSRLRYLRASPHGSGVEPLSLIREAHGVVLTQAPSVLDRYVTASGPNQHANMYRVSWEMAVLSPYAYLPSVAIDVDWDQVTRQPINWIHAADCDKPETCLDMPVMFSADCVPEEIERIETPPPVCGGCMPVGALDKYTFRVPTMEQPFRCRETAVSMVVTNTGELPLTLQAFWRVCGSDVRCEDNLWPLQIAGLPPGAELHLSGITGRFKAWHDELWRRPVGVVGTPNGAPWRPPVIDRHTCWDFIVQASSRMEFTISMVMADREA